jgi:acylphosphatase
MNEPEKDLLAEALARLSDNAHWRHYVGTVVLKRDGAVRALLYGEDKNVQALRGEARAFDQLVDQLKRYGVKT